MAVKKKATKKASKSKVVKKPVAKKSVKKSAAKKATKKSSVKKAAKKEVKSVKVSDTFTKTELLNVISERAELTKKQVSDVFDILGKVIEGHVKKSGPGKFAIPGLMKVVVRKVPAKKARKGINPFTGEEMMFKAKPASRKVKVTPLKALKDMLDA